MKLQIETNFGTFSFDMMPVNIRKVVDNAMALADEEKNGTKKEEQKLDPVALVAVYPEIVENANPVSQQPEIESMEKLLDIENGEEAYSGFLYIKCEKCGVPRGYCSKEKIKYSSCRCGHSTPLSGLKPMYVECECGGRFKYLTNMNEAQFETDCLQCGAPIDLELNNKRNSYVTMKDKNFSGGYQKKSHKRS